MFVHLDRIYAVSDLGESEESRKKEEGGGKVKM